MLHAGSCILLRLRFFRTHKPLHIFSDNIGFQIDQISNFPFSKRCHRICMRDRGNRKAVRCCSCHRQADTVDGDGAFLYNIAEKLWPRTDRIPHSIVIRPDFTDCSGSVNVTAHNVASEPSACCHSTFQIHMHAGFCPF